MLGLPLGILYANALEWGIHRWVLHGLGRKRGSFFSFHWYEHHRASRKNGMRDEGYESPVFSRFDGQSKEAVSLGLLGLLHLPIVAVSPWFSLGLLYSGINYYRVHRRAHLDPAWARANVPWHVDHHLGRDQDANWCVTKPWFDQLAGTRKTWPAEQASDQAVAA